MVRESVGPAPTPRTVCRVFTFQSRTTLELTPSASWLLPTSFGSAQPCASSATARAPAVHGPFILIFPASSSSGMSERFRPYEKSGFPGNEIPYLLQQLTLYRRNGRRPAHTALSRPVKSVMALVRYSA